MTVQEFKEIMLCNEPVFEYNGKEYSISNSLPDGKFYVLAEDNPASEDLVFDSVDDMLNHWIIQGKPLREIIPDTDFGQG